MTAHDVRAEDFAVFPAADDLDEAFRLIGGPGSPVGAEREAPHLELQLLLLALVFGQPDTGNFRLAVGDAGNVVVLDGRRMVPGDPLGHHDAFPASLVR